MDLTSTLYSSEDEFNSTDESNDELDELEQRQSATHNTSLENTEGKKPLNFINRLYNREIHGIFPGRSHSFHEPQQTYNPVPNRLKIYLKDMLDAEIESGHIYMGLTSCGQFLLSYNASCTESETIDHYPFYIGIKYTLYFWIFQPHKKLRLYYKCRLFDDRGIESFKTVTITQWKRPDNRILIVHGTAEENGEDSYITYIKVPKLGCTDCIKLRDMDENSPFVRCPTFCLKCNLTVHTKYSATDSDSKFNAYLNLLCPERIIIIANGFVHVLHIEIDIPRTSITPSPTLSFFTPGSPNMQLSMMERRLSQASTRASEDSYSSDHFQVNQVIAHTMADLSDIETESTHSGGSRSNERLRVAFEDRIPAVNGNLTCVNIPKYCEEWVYTGINRLEGSPIQHLNTHTTMKNNNVPKTARNVISNGSPNRVSANSPNRTNKSNSNSTPNKLINNTVVGTGVHVQSPNGKRHQRIVTKSFRNNSGTGTSSSNNDRASAYDFSEDTEKCEKIAILRKRRLAEKKYEFSEDNTENIIPFTKVRLANKSTSTNLANHARTLYRSNAVYHHYHGAANSPVRSSTSSAHIAHAVSPGRGSPISIQQGFRSPPCSSTTINNVAGNGLMRSPSRLPSGSQSIKPLGTLSPLQIALNKRNYIDLGAVSPSGNVPFLSPRRDDLRIIEVPLQNGVLNEKPCCSKKFRRRYVDEDDAASVITSEEDDCISPGYHTSLPIEVHGASYSEMQMISQASYKQLRCPSVVITQHSFDIEAFTYYALSTLCQKNNKIYDVFYDWAYEPISVCPRSMILCCLLLAQFSARDQMSAPSMKCIDCTSKLQCIYHRHYYEGRILFTWNMESGELQVLDYGELMTCKDTDIFNLIKRKCDLSSMPLKAKKLAQELAAGCAKYEDLTNNLRVLDSNLKKSKSYIVDNDHMIEFHLKRPRIND